VLAARHVQHYSSTVIIFFMGVVISVCKAAT